MANEINTQDPVSWWLAFGDGTPQSWGILGTALGIYRIVAFGKGVACETIIYIIHLTM
jgi:hypothetical protein